MEHRGQCTAIGTESVREQDRHQVQPSGIDPARGLAIERPNLGRPRFLSTNGGPFRRLEVG